MTLDILGVLVRQFLEFASIWFCLMCLPYYLSLKQQIQVLSTDHKFMSLTMCLDSADL